MTNPNKKQKPFDEMTDEEKEAQWDKTLNSQESSDFIDSLLLSAQDEISRGNFTEDK